MNSYLLITMRSFRPLRLVVVGQWVWANGGVEFDFRMGQILLT